MKILKYLIVLIVILVAAAWLWGKFYGKGEASRQEFKLAKVSRGDIQAIVTSTGRLNPLNTVKVGTQVSGNIKELYVDFNSLVKKDQVIALIDPAIYGALRFKPPGEVSRAKPGKRPPIKERSFYKNTVKKVGLDAGQSEELVRIIEQAGKKLKAAYALPEEERDPRQAWQGFFTQVFNRGDSRPMWPNSKRRKKNGDCTKGARPRCMSRVRAVNPGS